MPDGSLRLTIEADPDDDACATVLVDGTVAGRPHRFILDTGAGRTQLRADEWTATLARTGSHSCAGVFGPEMSDCVAVPELWVGPLGGEDVDVVVSDSRLPHGLLGMDVLARHRCEFRFDDRQLVVDGPHAGTLPLRMDGVGHPYIDVHWPGVAAQAVWDTGAGITVIDYAFWAARPDLFTPAGTSTGTDATGAQLEMPVNLVAAAVIGGLTFAPHRVAVIDLSAANAVLEMRMDVVLGYPALRQANWMFDFPARTWSTTRPHTTLCAQWNDRCFAAF